LKIKESVKMVSKHKKLEKWKNRKKDYLDDKKSSTHSTSTNKKKEKKKKKRKPVNRNNLLFFYEMKHLFNNSLKPKEDK